MLRDYSGAAKPTTLAGAISASATSFTVADGAGYPMGVAGPFVVTLDTGLASEEKILCASRTGNTLTVESGGRGWDGTTASDHDNGASVAHTFSATDAREANAHVNDTEGDPHPQYLTAAEGAAFVPRVLVDAKGDLFAGSAADTVVRVPVGTDGQVLTANPAAPAGVGWETLSVGPIYAASLPAIADNTSGATAKQIGVFTFNVTAGRRYGIHVTAHVAAQANTNAGFSRELYFYISRAGSSTGNGTFLASDGPYSGVGNTYAVGAFQVLRDPEQSSHYGHAYHLFTATASGTLNVPINYAAFSSMNYVNVEANACTMVVFDLGPA